MHNPNHVDHPNENGRVFNLNNYLKVDEETLT